MFTQLILTDLLWTYVSHENPGTELILYMETILNKTKDFYVDKPRTRSGNPLLLFYFNNPVAEICFWWIFSKLS